MRQHEGRVRAEAALRGVGGMALIDDGRPATIANQWQRALGYGIRLRIDPHAEWLLPLDRYAAHPIFQPGIVHRGGLAIRARTVNWVRGFSGEAKGAAVATDDPFLPFFLPSFLPSIHPSIHRALPTTRGGKKKRKKTPPAPNTELNLKRLDG